MINKNSAWIDTFRRVLLGFEILTLFILMEIALATSVLADSWIATVIGTIYRRSIKTGQLGSN